MLVSTHQTEVYIHYCGFVSKHIRKGGGAGALPSSKDG